MSTVTKIRRLAGDRNAPDDYNLAKAWAIAQALEMYGGEDNPNELDKEVLAILAQTIVELLGDHVSYRWRGSCLDDTDAAEGGAA